jgi:5-methylcytosine-specific restriction endonuclease McrA
VGAMKDDPLILKTLREACSTDQGRRKFCELFIQLLGESSWNSVEARFRASVYPLMKYSDYLTTHHWKEVARVTKDRAGHRCQLCNSERNLEAHHRTYERLGREDEGDVTVLCNTCHSKFHDKIPK